MKTHTRTHAHTHTPLTHTYSHLHTRFLGGTEAPHQAGNVPKSFPFKLGNCKLPPVLTCSRPESVNSLTLPHLPNP